MSTEQYNPVPLTNQQRAQSVVKDLSASEIAVEVERLLNELDYQQEQTQKAIQYKSISASNYTELYDKVEEFLTEHIKSGDIDKNDLIKFAADLDMELTKTIKVNFNVVCEYEFKVPLSYDESDFSEGDFDIKISANITDDDVEETHESFEVEDFEVEDND